MGVLLTAYRVFMDLTQDMFVEEWNVGAVGVPGFLVMMLLVHDMCGYLNMYEILRRIVKERERQDAKWGVQNHPPAYWLSILGEEYGELCKAINETIGCGDKKGNHKEVVEEAIQVAAVAIAMIESVERNEV